MTNYADMSEAERAAIVAERMGWKPELSYRPDQAWIDDQGNRYVHLPRPESDWRDFGRAWEWAAANKGDDLFGMWSEGAWWTKMPDEGHCEQISEDGDKPRTAFVLALLEATALDREAAPGAGE